jgi:hypothetical protein
MLERAVIALLLITFGWLSEPQAFAGEPGQARLSLERSEDLETAFGAFDFDQVRVFTWRGGILQGKINFQDGQNIKPVDLEERLTKAAKSLLLKGETFDPRTMHGALVMTIKNPEGKEIKERRCRVSIAFSFNIDPREDKIAVLGTSVIIEGRIPNEGAANKRLLAGGKQIARESFGPTGKEFTLYELYLSGKDEKSK